MIVLVIGDVHGTDNWERYNFEDYDKVIFIGDYFDDWSNDWSKINQIDNLKEILKLKKSNSKKFELILGNHDLAYIIPESVSGKQNNKEFDIREFILKNIKNFSMVVQHKNYLFSHAGITRTWFKYNLFKNINMINDCLQKRILSPFKFYKYAVDSCGNDVEQGCTWVRPKMLASDPYGKCNQIVGHTARDIIGYQFIKMKNDSDLYIVDNSRHSAFLEIEI